MLDLGEYPRVSLQDARKERDRRRDVLAQGIDPPGARCLTSGEAAGSVASDDSFEGVAREWMSKQKKWSDSTRSKVLWLFTTYAFPWIGKRPIGAITTPEMLKLLRRIEERGVHEKEQ